MKKILLFLIFALFCIPWAANAQTAITLNQNLTQALTLGTTYNFYDSGGEEGSYDTNQTYTATFTFSGEITINFSQFVTESSSYCSNFDYMLIYDGDAATGTLLARGQTGCSSATLTIGEDIVAETGVMTVEWHSDESVTAAGWVATITCQETDCPIPTNFTVSNVTANSATLNWECDTDFPFDLEYGTDITFTTKTDVDNIEGTSYVLTDLSPETTYYVRVHTDCDMYISSWVSKSFTTAEECPEGMVCIGTGVATSNYVPANNYYNYSLTQQIYTADEIGEAGAILSIDFFKADSTEMVKNLDIYMVSTTKDEFTGTDDFVPVTAGDLVFSGTVTFADNAWTTIELDAPFAFDGTSNVAIMVDNNTGGYVSSTPFYVFTSDKNQALYAQSDGTNHDPFAPAFSYRTTQKNRVRLNIGEPPACLKPTGVTVNYTGGTTATVTWNGDATDYNLKLNDVVVVGGLWDTEYELTNLELATTYEVSVQAYCAGVGISEWTNPVSFTTDLCAPENQCEITYELADSYGDGWNGNTLSVVDVATEVVLATWTIPSGDSSASGSLALCDGREIQFVWAGNNWPSENSFTVYDINGEIICQHIKNDVGPAVGILSNYTMSCTVSPCRKPTNLAASEIGKRTATLSWTENGEATAWNLKVNGELIENVANPYTLTGLTPETAYTVQVSPVCEVEKWSDAITFRTEVACPAPTALEVVPTPFSATVTWTGDASNYTLRYGTCAEPDPTQPATIIFHADDVWQDGSGYQMLLDADATAYGTIIPETGALTESGDASAEVYAEFEYKIPANADGECSTSNVVIDNTITLQIPAGTYDWCITNPTPGDRIWIASAQGNVGGRADDYVFEGGMIYEFNMYMLGSNDATDVTVMCSNVDWATVNNATSPFTINGLDPETEYYVGVQTVCGGEDGESVWTNAVFTTPSNCEAPSALNVTNLMPTTASLNWTGYQDGFEVGYRPVAQGEELASIDFDDSSMGGWTTIDADGDGYGWILGSACDGVYLNGGNLAGNGHNSSADLVTSGSYSNVAAALTPDNYLVSPQVELGGSITFWAAAQDATYAAEVFGVAVSTTSNTDSSAFTTIQNWTMAAKSTGASTATSRSGNRAVGSWYQYTVDLSDYAGQTGYVAIRHYNCTDQFMLDVDDITIYGPAPEEQEWTIVSADATTLDITGLTEGTAYEWKVRGVNSSCDGGYSEWSEIGNFTTPSACDVPVSLEAEVNGTSATLSWTGYQDSYNVTYGAPATGDILIETGMPFDGYNDWTPVTEDEESGFYYLGSDYSIIGFGFSSTSTPQYLISPEFEALEGNSFVEFEYYAYQATDEEVPETFQIGYSMTDNEVASFTWGDVITVSDRDYYTKDLPEGAKYFAIKYTSDHPQDSTILLFLDFTLVSNYVPAGEVVTLTNVTSSVTITGLEPETYYEWYVEGINTECAGDMTSETATFTTGEQSPQTIALSAGTNWVSFNVETNLDALKAALVATGNTAITIQGQSLNATYNPNNGRWTGQLRVLDLSQMYKIKVADACEITLEGTPVDPSMYPVTIAPGVNYIAYPFNTNMTVTDAFAGFGVNGDVVQSQLQNANFNGSRWIGQLRNLEPGKGYIYKSAASESRTFTFPYSSR